MSDRGGASLGTAEGRITVDASQAISELGRVGSALNNLDARTTGGALGGQFNDFNQSVVSLAQGMQNLGRVTLGVGAAMTAPFVGAAKSAIDFEHQMAGVNAVMDLTDSQFQELSDLAQQLGKDTFFSGQEAAEGIETLGKAGISFEDIVSGAAQAATELAVAGETDIPRTAEVMAAAMQAFNIEGEDAIRVADALAGMANLTLSDISQLGIGLAQVSGVANAAGMSMEETAAFIGLLADNGLRGSDAATSMKTAILALLSPTDKAAGIMDELGISLLDTEGNFIGLAGASQEFFEAWQRSGQTMSEFMEPLSDILGRDAVRTILFGMQAIQSGLDGTGKSFDDYIAAASDAGAASEFAAARMDSTAGAIEKLRGSFIVLLEELGKPMLAVIRPFVEGLTTLIDALTQLPEPVLAAVAAFGTLAGVLTTAAGAFLLVGGYLIEAIARFTAGGASLAILIPYLVQIARLATIAALAVGALALAWEKNFLGIRDLVGAVGEDIEKIGDNIEESNAAADRADMSGLERGVYALGRALSQSGIPAVRDFGRFLITNIAQGINQAENLFNDLTKRGVNPLIAGLKAVARFWDVATGIGPSGFADTLNRVADAARNLTDNFAIFQDALSQRGVEGVANTIGAIGLAIERTFGAGPISDAIMGLADQIILFQAAWQDATNLGLNPATRAFYALAAVASNLGLDGLAEQMVRLANAAETFGDSFGEIFTASMAEGATGLAAAIRAVGFAIDQVAGTDLYDTFNRIANAIDLAANAFNFFRANGVNPVEAALRALQLGLQDLLGIDLVTPFDNLGTALAGIRDTIGADFQGALDRIGQFFSEIGTAIGQADFSGVLAAIQGLAADVQNELLNLVNQIGTIDVGQIVLNIADWIINAAQTVADAVREFVFGNTGGAPSPGLGGVAGQSEGLLGGIDLGAVAIGIRDWIISAATSLADKIRDFILGGGQIGGTAPAGLGGTVGQGTGGINLGTIAVTIGDWLVSAARSIWEAIQSFVTGTVGGGVPSPGLGGFPGQGGINLEAVKVNIASWARGTWASLGDIANQIKDFITNELLGAAISVENFTGWSLTLGLPTGAAGAPGGPIQQIAGIGGGGVDFGNFIRTQLEEAAIAIDDFTGWDLTVGEPGNMEINAPGLQERFANLIIEFFTVSPESVDLAGRIGEALGKTIGEGLAAALRFAIDMVAGGGGLPPGIVTDKAGFGTVQSLHLGDAFAAFDTAFTEAVQAALEDEFAEAEAALKSWIEERKSEFFQNILEDIFFFPTGSVLPGGQLDPGPIDEVGDKLTADTKEQLDANQPELNREAQLAGRDAGLAYQESLAKGMGAGMDAGTPFLGEAIEQGLGLPTLDWLEPLGRVKDHIIGPGLNPETQAKEAVGEGFFDPFNAQVSESVKSGMQDSGEAIDASIQSGAESLAIGEALDSVMASQVGSISLEEFSRAIGERINQAILEGITGASAEGGGSFRGGTGQIGQQIADSLSTSITGADFSSVGTAISTKISEVIVTSLSGASEGAGGVAGGAASGLGNTIAASLANAITGADFTSVGAAISAKISEVIVTSLSGASGEAGGAAGGAAAGLGNTIAASLASAITGADFTSVGAAISTKLGAAIVVGMSSGGQQAGGAGGAASGIGNTIAASIANAISGADFSSVGAEVSRKIGESLGQSTGSLTSAMSAVMQAIVAAGQQAAGQAAQVGQQIVAGIAQGIAPGSGVISAQVVAVVNTAVAQATAAGAAANQVGSAIIAGITQGVAGGSGSVSSSVSSVVTSAISAGQGTAAGATAIGSAIIAGITSGIAGGGGQVGAGVSAVVQQGIAAGQGAAGEAYSIGSAIIAGILAGLAGGGGQVAAAVASIVREGIAAGMAEAGASSPSKVMMQLGEWMNEGLVIGIESGSSDAERAGRDIARSAIEGAKGVGQAASELQAFADGFSDLGGAQEFATELESISSSLDDAGKDVRSKIKGMMDDINSRLREGGKAVSNTAKSVGSSVSAGVSAVDKARESITAFRGAKRSAKGVLIDLRSMDDEIQSIRDWANAFSQVAGPHDFAQELTTIADNIESSRADAIQGTRDLIQQMESEIRAAKKRASDESKEVGRSVPEGITSGMTESSAEVGDATQSTIDQITNVLNPNLKRLPEMAEAIGQGIGTGLQSGLEEATPGIQEAAGGVGDATAQGLAASEPVVETAATEMVETTTQAMDTAAGEQSDFARTIGELIATTFGDGFASGADPAKGVEMVKTFHAGIRDAVLSLTPQVNQSGSQIGSAFSQGVDQVNPTQAGKSLVDEVGQGITTGTPPTVNQADRSGEQIGNALSSGIEETCGTVNEGAHDLTDSCIPKGIESGLNEATGTAQDAGEEVSDSLMKGLDIKKKDVERNFDQAGQGFTRSMASGIKNTAGDAVNSAKDVAANAGRLDAKGEGTSVGKSLGQGIADGIKSMSSAVQEAARQVVKDAEAAAKKEAESKSPSRVFMEIGRDLDLGLAEGMLRNTQYVIDAAGNLLDATQGVLSGTAITAATRFLDRRFDTYTGRIEDVVGFVDRSMSGNKLPKSILASLTGVSRDISAMPVAQPQNVSGDTFIIEGIEVSADSPEGRAARNLLDALRSTTGQYRRA